MRDMLVRPHIPMSKDEGRSQETVLRFMRVMGRPSSPKRVSPSGFGRRELTVYRIQVETDGDIS
jgi:hypothetical protein